MRRLCMDGDESSPLLKADEGVRAPFESALPNSANAEVCPPVLVGNAPQRLRPGDCWPFLDHFSAHAGTGSRDGTRLESAERAAMMPAPE